MGLLHDALQQAHIWRAYLHLKSPDDAERARAMETLRAAGSASLPCLNFAVSRAHEPRVQFAAAVVLHWLDEPQGLETLREALLWRLNSDPSLAPELEAALIAIGSPDAVTALIEIWKHLPEWSDCNRVMESICRVWAALRDPRALEALTARATRIPDLFLQTVPVFGEMAVLHLARMLRDPEKARRILAIRALGRIHSRQGQVALVPLLCDLDPTVRAEVPQALESAGDAFYAAEAVANAIRAGCSTPEAVRLLAHSGRYDACETLLALVTRWNPQTAQTSGDTGPAVLAAVTELADAPLPNAALVPPLCALLERRPGPDLAAAIARALGQRGPSGEYDARIRDTLTPLLASADNEVRDEAADALVRLGEPLGKQIIRLIAAHRPQETPLNAFRKLLSSGADNRQVMQAFQQASQWFSQRSKETVERLFAPATDESESALPDPRLPDLLRQLLGNALDALERATWTEETEEQLSLCVAAIGALSRLGSPIALCARKELLRALHTLKYSLVYEGGIGPQRRSERREVGDTVRTAAAAALIQLYGKSSFPLFLEALYAPHRAIQDTAILGLGRVGDVRALPHLEAIAGNTTHPLARMAQEMIAVIEKRHPERMELLRASTATEMRPDILLRPASGNSHEVSSDLLLRPTAQEPTPAHTPILPTQAQD
ncbi:MAG TPA: HEAT repeat domain-containing protein [Chthonomonadaceae bacterium]|nr:HEAT repeat domain-containing protein [Chthonomonadaceae bacterium]